VLLVGTLLIYEWDLMMKYHFTEQLFLYWRNYQDKMHTLYLASRCASIEFIDLVCDDLREYTFTISSTALFIHTVADFTVTYLSHGRLMVENL